MSARISRQRSIMSSQFALPSHLNGTHRQKTVRCAHDGQNQVHEVSTCSLSFGAIKVPSCRRSACSFLGWISGHPDSANPSLSSRPRAAKEVQHGIGFAHQVKIRFGCLGH